MSRHNNNLNLSRGSSKTQTWHLLRSWHRWNIHTSTIALSHAINHSANPGTQPPTFSLQQQFTLQLGGSSLTPAKGGSVT